MLTGQLQAQADGTSIPISRPSFEGTAAPEAKVRLVAVARGSNDAVVMGRTTAGADGSWSLTSRSLQDGTYRVLARSNAPADPSWPRVRVLPNADLGTIKINAKQWGI